MKKLIFTAVFGLMVIGTSATAQQLTIQERLARLERNAASSQGIAELVIQVQQLQQEVAQLRGQLEQQAFELESLKKRQKVLYMDMDSRLQALESQPESERAGQAPGSSHLAGQVNPDAPLTAVAPEGNPPDVPVAESPEQGAQAGDLVENSDAAATALYDDAFAHLKAGRYTDSARLFEDFIQRYPNHDLTDNAYYWLGESYYVTRNYELALNAFEQLKSRFPDSNKLADALLKIGYTQYELGLYPQALHALQTVVREFPGSAVARLAQTRLRKMQREGKVD